MTLLLAQAEPPDELSWLWFVLYMGGAGLFAWLLGVFRRGSVLGPVRWPAEASVGLLVIVGAVGAALWVGMQVVYVGIKIAASGGRLDGFSAGDYVFLATVPFLVGALALLAGDSLLGRATFERIGLTWGRLGRGIVHGVMATLVIVPLVFGASMPLDALYRLIEFEIPEAHELLIAVREAPNAVLKGLLIFGATVVVPVFEEYLFRGHLQTVLVRAFTFPRTLSISQTGLVHPVQGAPEARLIEYETPIKASPGYVWLAIALTSIVFMAVHEPWMWPLIFLLSMALGYAYERTGNLWVPIVVHAVFNTVSTVMWLYLL